MSQQQWFRFTFYVFSEEYVKEGDEDLDEEDLDEEDLEDNDMAIPRRYVKEMLRFLAFLLV